MVLTYGDTAVVGGGVEGAPGQHILPGVLTYVDTAVAGGGVEGAPGQHILPGVLTYVDTEVAGGGVEGASGQHIPVLPGVLTYGDTAVAGGGYEGAPGQHILLGVLKYVDTVVAGGGVPGRHILPGVLTVPMLILRLLVVVLKVHLASTYSPGCTHSSCYIKQNQDLLISYIFAPKVYVKIYQRHSFVLKKK